MNPFLSTPIELSDVVRSPHLLDELRQHYRRLARKPATAPENGLPQEPDLSWGDL
jgi:hypothetical protein